MNIWWCYGIVKQRYTCGGCGWKWSINWRAPFKVAALFDNHDRLIVVPSDKSPCCRMQGEEGGG